MAALGYPGFGGSIHPNGHSVPPAINPGTIVTQGQFPNIPGPGYMASNPGMPGANMPIVSQGMLGMTMHDQAEAARMAQDYEALVNIIKQWNANRLDLFALTLPNEVSIPF
jgi:hypothetical protein